MSNREALRELQGRLADRLQQARTELPQRSWLAVECAGQGFVVPLVSAGEIFPASALQPVSHTQPWFLGVANLRGSLHGVIDLAAFLGLRPPLAPHAWREQSRLLTFNAALNSHCAVLVDRLAGLRGAAELTAQAESGAVRPAFAAAQWRDAQDRCWQEIDLEALSRDEQFLAIAA